jgi:hypothetical protein
VELPASLRELNPVVDQMARGEPVHDGAAMRLAVALGLATPDRSLSEAGRAYARPALAEGPLSLVMSPERRAAALPLLGGTLPLQASLRRLLRQIVQHGETLVSPLSLGWPEALLRPYLAYLEDLGLLVAIGPLVEATPKGRTAALQVCPPPCPPPWEPPYERAGPASMPSFQCPIFRFHLVRQACLNLLVLRGRREWHLLQPLLDGPLALLKPAYTEWLERFQADQPSVRRSWAPDLVGRFAKSEPAPGWFAPWCMALLGAGPEGVEAALARSPALLHSAAVLAGGLPCREAWVMAEAITWASRQGRGLRYAEAAGRLRADGLSPASWPRMQRILESAGLLLGGHPDEVRLLLPVEIHPPADALWPYGGPEWVAAALLEGGALALAGPARRPVHA